MMEKDKLRKADLFSGGIIFLLGCFIVSQAMGMPMTDSWGGVQNVWYVSPALFPLLVGSMIMLLGGFLVRTAIKTVGFKGFGEVLGFIFSPAMKEFAAQKANIRFFAIITLFISYVFLMLPRIDFFLATILFLAAFIPMFYFDNDGALVRLFRFYLAQIVCLFIFIILTPSKISLTNYPLDYPADWLMLGLIPALILFTGRIARHDALLWKRYKLAMTLAVVAPILIGGIFKYLLLVPMPFEGIVVELMDMIWYFEF